MEAFLSDATDAAETAQTLKAIAMPPPPLPTDPTQEQIGDITDGALNLVLAQETRWNSAEAEFSRFIKLRVVVQHFMEKYRIKGYTVPELRPEDWKVLETVINVL